MHKLTLITYLITSFFIETLKKADEKLSLCICIGNSYFPPNFNIFQQSFIPIFSNNRAT